MSQLTLYEICGEDMQLTARRLSNGSIEIEVLNALDEPVFRETTHQHAWDSLIFFARQILHAEQCIQARSCND